MVKLRHHEPPRAIVVKPARAVPRHKRKAKARCVVCCAILRDDHDRGDVVCDPCARQNGGPRSDPPRPMVLTPEERLLVMLYRAGGAPLNLYRAFGCTSTNTNKSWFRDAVKRLTASGLVRIVGRKRIGYELATQRRCRDAMVET